MFQGVITALITPFSQNTANIDYSSLHKILDLQLNSSVQGILIAGTTGENPTLNTQEYKELIRFCAKHIQGKKTLWVGTGSNNTSTTLDKMNIAQNEGADVALVVTPFYNKPEQEGLYQHFYKIANQNPKFPICLYNVPSRTGCRLKSSTAIKLAKESPNIQCIKEASGDLEDIAKLIASNTISVLSGDDFLTLPMISLGASGVVSVLANIIPNVCYDFIEKCRTSKWNEAQKILFKHQKLIELLFSETNPAPIKQAMSLKGYCEPFPRLPLTKLSSKNYQLLQNELSKLQYI